MNKGAQVSNSGRHGRTDRKKPKHAPADRRARRTRLALHEALIRSVLKKGYDAISVSDIAAEANVGRSTFYCHFGGMDDLIRDTADRIRDVLLAHQRSAASGHEDAASPLGFGSFMFAHTKEQLRLYRALVRGRAGTIILDRLRLVLAEILRDGLTALGDGAHTGVPREFAVQYLIGGFMAVLTWWLDRGAKEPPEAMDAAFRALAMHGLGNHRHHAATDR
jgi:AcrR family transcriptional regulator